MEERLQELEVFCRQFWEGMWGAIGRLDPYLEAESGGLALADFCYDPKTFVLVLSGSRTFVGLEQVLRALLQVKEFDPSFGREVKFQTVSVSCEGDTLTALVMYQIIIRGLIVSGANYLSMRQRKLVRLHAGVAPELSLLLPTR